MNISAKSIEALGKIVTGDEKLSPYRSGPKLVRFFNEFGGNDVYPAGGGFPSRWAYAEKKLTTLNGTPGLRKVIERVLDPREYVELEVKPEQAADFLNKYFQFDGLQVVREANTFKVRSLKGSDVELQRPYDVPTELTHLLIEEHVAKCERKIDEQDYSGAITNARALIETTLVGVEKELDSNAPEYNGDLVQMYRRVQKLLNLDPGRKDIADPLKQILSGLNSIVNGLAAMRNKMSDSHAAVFRPSRHHAKLAVNAAKTLCDFIFETKGYQISKGSVKAQM
jgi:hypothetical protein